MECSIDKVFFLQLFRVTISWFWFYFINYLCLRFHEYLAVEYNYKDRR